VPRAKPVQTDLVPQLERFVVGERLGRGGMGVVYRARDRTTNLEIAIKVLSRLDGDSLYRFKREFRALADLSHPNLVDLYELHSAGEQWCFTMELVDGVRFDEFLGTSWGAPDVSPTSPTMVTTPSGPPIAGAPAPLPPEPTAGAPANRQVPERFWPAFEQLVEGVQALHRAGILHRDIKPSNVLVTPTGRVVLCDFGLVTEVQTRGALDAHDTVMGTPLYMSPEQAAGKPTSQATDWYAVGVMLYQALTGRLPFSGDPVQVLWHKSSSEPPPPSRYNPSIDPDVDALCVGLLRRDPALRAGGRDILSYLGRRAAGFVAVSAGGEVVTATPFVGRDRELARLRDALAASRVGRHSVTVLVRGLSGMGKTALVRRFLDEVREDPQAVVLAGRCYEREAVPYKALDTIVDALSAHLVRLPADEIERALPPDIAALARLFPVMRRVHGAAQPPRALDSPDPYESRRRALGALRHILQHLAEHHPVVLFVDDLQWGDIDSAPFLADLMHHADAPPVLLLTSIRREDAGTSPLLRKLLHREGVPGGSSGDLREIDLEPLSHAEAETLGRELLTSDPAGASARASRIADDSGGSPLFVLELARAGALAAAGLGLEAVMLDRIGRLSGSARALLTTIAVAGRPTPQAVIAGSLGAALDPALVNQLRAERLVRTSTSGADSLLEPYHDRLREALVGKLSSAERKRVHRALATAFQQRGGADPQTLVEHWAGAGFNEEAGRYALIAAARAEEALAFHRAVTYYEQSLLLRPGTPAEALSVKARLAIALGNAGRLADAAALSLEAAHGAEPEQALELRRQAMESLLFAGRLKEGLETAAIVAAGVGLHVPRTLNGALWTVARGRLAIRLRGLSFREKPAAEISPAALRRLDVCWSLTHGLAFVDPLIGLAFQVRHLRDALDMGEPYRAALAIGVEIGYRSIGGTASWHRVEPLFAPGMAMAERTGNPQAVAFVHATTALAYYLVGKWHKAVDHLRQGEQLWRDHGSQIRSASDVLQVYLLSALIQIGETREVGALMKLYLQEAIERGDHYSATALKTWRSNVAWLVMDRPEEARQLALESQLQSPGDGFHLHHHHELLTHGHIDLYVGDARAAWQRVESTWPRLERAHLFRIQSVRIEAWLLRASAALAFAAIEPRGREQALHLVERMMRKIEREHSPWGAAYVPLLTAGLRLVRGRADAAPALLIEAARRFDAFEMPLLAAVARRRHGQLVGGTEGAAEVAAADRTMSERGVVAPARLAAMYAPGFGD
jgi:tetratricopeptide (TPR) repeat protein